MTIKITSNIRKIEKILEKHWASNEKAVKPRFKVVFIYSEEKNRINGYIYAYDINDGYFHECILDDLDIKQKLDKKYAEKLIKKLIYYCKKEKIEIIITRIGRYHNLKQEMGLYKKLGFEIQKKEKIAEFDIK